ncbi:MAG: type II toxin-antitoxin system RelE/ParE family toxin, partial [Candidatus Obscuribacterales bacterium]|nr:type II toxin-antitoxin system RelE/ParE family toxin [Candidatus Obscuribacterales bacterium]
MTTLIISPEARADLEEIGDYIAQDNVEAAISFIERLETCCMNIARS